MNLIQLLYDNLPVAIAAATGIVITASIPPIAKSIRRFSYWLLLVVKKRIMDVVPYVMRFLWWCYLPLCSKAVQRDRSELITHIGAMLLDTTNQRWGSFIESSSNDLDDKADNVIEKIATVAIGRTEALKDIISFLDSETYPPETWDTRGNNTTEPSYTVISGEAIIWRWVDDDEQGRWIILERVEKKWGRKHRFYFRPDLRRDGGTL